MLPTLYVSHPLLSMVLATLAFATVTLVTTARAARWAQTHLRPVPVRAQRPSRRPVR